MPNVRVLFWPVLSHEAGAAVSPLEAMGVDEVACLIDYGVPHDEVLSSLSYLAELNGCVLV